MSLLRAFIAIEIPPEICKAIEYETATLRNALSQSLVRWTSTSNMHLTLKFLGDTSPSNVDMLTQMLTAQANQHPTFEMVFGGLGVFPNPKRPRVFWIGLQAPDELTALQRGIEAASAKLGYPLEKRPFSPHLTIGRVKQRVNSKDIKNICTAYEETEIGTLGIANVTAVQLFKSDLKPTGAIYTRLHSAPLQTRGDN